MEASRLSEIDLFDGMSDDDLAACAEWFDEREFPAGKSPVKQGDFSYRFFIVLDGEVEVRRDFELLARLGPGDFFGEMGVTEGALRSARVTPITHCTLASMMTWNYREMADRFPAVSNRIEQKIAERASP
ncbi:MAG TPA: cyclic nucleotide-binding domain-containing protein [Acidimicrobiales bacterium]|nr:cyclic nucleotide-binding domain-containing protein [Acidimicrobiales bacterium]